MWSSIPVSPVTTGGMGRPGSTRVLKRSSTRRPLMRTAPISVTLEWPGEPAGGLEVDDAEDGLGEVGVRPVGRREADQVAPEPGEPRVALDDLGDQAALQALGAAAQAQELRRDVAHLEGTAPPHEQRAEPVGHGVTALGAGLGRGQGKPELGGDGQPATDANGGLRRHRPALRGRRDPGARGARDRSSWALAIRGGSPSTSRRTARAPDAPAAVSTTGPTVAISAVEPPAG